MSRRDLLKIAGVSSATLVLLPPSGVSGATRGAAPKLLNLDGDWLLAHDPENLGLDQKWFSTQPPAAHQIHVPGIAQNVLRGAYGVFWYWRDFEAPQLDESRGSAWLNVRGVDYAATVWLNGTLVARHEGVEIPFLADVTSALRPGATNRCVIRIVNPTHEVIDGFTLDEVPKGAKVMPYYAGASWDTGGITDSIELIAVAQGVLIDDVWVRPDPSTGRIALSLEVRNSGRTLPATLQVSVSRAGRQPSTTTRTAVTVASGTQTLSAAVTVNKPDLWDLDHPNLYAVAVRLQDAKGDVLGERTVRCGFRDFRVENGYFRLNGRRLFLKSAHTCNDRPHGLSPAEDREFLRQDLLHLKSMGFDMVRFIWGGATREQLDLCDEIGLMVYRETRAAWPMAESPEMGARFDDIVRGVIQRDRNHPSVAVWGLLNETGDGPVFRHAVGMLELIRELDDSRLVMLGSGRWDAQPGIGSVSNPGSREWQYEFGDERPGAPPSGSPLEGVGDIHFYGRVPHPPDVIRFLRNVGRGMRSGIFFSEYGIGSAVDLWDNVKEYKRRGIENLDDARFYADRLDRFLADRVRWKLNEVFPTEQSYFTASMSKMAGQRRLGLNAIRSNPSVVGHNLTGAVDEVMCGEGLATTFRKLKPGVTQAISDAFAPLRWCLFADPPTQRRDVGVRLEAVLVNEDVLRAGTHTARFEVLGPSGKRVFDRSVEVRVGANKEAEAPFASSVFAEDVPIDGPAGPYRFRATLAHRGRRLTAETGLLIDDALAMPSVQRDVLFWGDWSTSGWRDLAAYTASGYKGMREWHEESPTTVGYVWPASLHPGPASDTARAWTAPRDGTVDVSGRVAKGDPRGNGVVVRIMRNDQTVWGPTTIGGNDAVGIEATVRNLAVRNGDVIRFVIANNGDWSADETLWDPTIAYHGGASAKASDGFSATQGANGWRYQTQDYDSELVHFLETCGARVHRFADDPGTLRLPIVCGSRPPAGDVATRFRELTERIGRGSTAIFLSHEVLARGADPLGWAPPSQSSWHDIAVYRPSGYKGMPEWHAETPAPGGYVWPGAQHPGPGNETARAWTAPRDGTVDVSGHAAKPADEITGNGVVVRIMRNDETVWGPTTIGGADAAGVQTDVGGLAVRTADVIRFVIGNNGDWGADETLWDPTISYHDGISVRASDGFSATQGANGWRYQDADANGMGSIAEIYGWLYLKDEWAKKHPIFAGLPAGGLLDYAVYEPVIPDTVLVGQPEAGLVAVAGAIKASQDYSSGLMVAVYPLGAGRFVLNTLKIRANLQTPVGERLLRNMVRFAGEQAGQPLASKG